MRRRGEVQCVALGVKPLEDGGVALAAHQAVELRAIVGHQADSVEAEVVHAPTRAASDHVGGDRKVVASCRQGQAHSRTLAGDGLGAEHEPLAHPIRGTARGLADARHEAFGQETGHEPRRLVALRAGEPPPIGAERMACGGREVEHRRHDVAGVRGALFDAQTAILGDGQELFDAIAELIAWTRRPGRRRGIETNNEREQRQEYACHGGPPLLRAARTDPLVVQGTCSRPPARPFVPCPAALYVGSQAETNPNE